MRKKSLFLLFLWVIFFPFLTYGQENAKDILEKVSASFAPNKGYSIAFTVNSKQIREKVSESFNATIDIKGSRFRLKTPDAEAWFNGKTQWVLMFQTDEVNVSNPTEQELKEINPIQIINSFKKGYSCVYKGERNDFKGKKSYVIELIPESKGENIEYISLLVRQNNYFLSSILIRQKGSIETSIYIDHIDSDVNFRDSHFVFDKKEYPNTEVIDLR